MEGSKIEQQGTPSLPESKAGILSKLRDVLGEVLEILKSADTRTKRYSLEEMGRPEVVARVILGQTGNPLRKRFGRNPWENGFSLVTLLSNMGYPPIITREDHFKNLSGEARERYLTLRQTLRRISARETDPQELKATKPLLEYQLEKPDAYGETVHYQVVNPDVLLEISKTNVLRP